MNIIYPIQPFFVIHSDKYYKKLSAHTVVSHYYKFRGNPRLSACCAVPDGAVDILFLCDPERPRAMVCTTVDHAMPAGFEDEGTYFGVRLLPGFFDHIGKISTHELMMHEYSIDEVLREPGLAELIAAEAEFDRQITIFEDSFLKRVGSGNDSRYQITQSVLRGIYSSAGSLKVKDLEEELHYSRRHLTRCFEDTMGMDIKRFSSYIRFQSVLKRMNNGEFENLAEAAAAGSYYDQTHFQKDFKRFTNITPKEYLKLLKEINYEQKMTVC